MVTLAGKGIVMESMGSSDITTGVVLRASRVALHVRLDQPVVLTSQQLLQCTVAQLGGTASFKAKCSSIENDEALLFVLSGLNYNSTPIDPCVSVSMTGVLSQEFVDATVQVTNASRHGIGFCGDFTLARGQEATIKLAAPGGEIELHGCVKLCHSPGASGKSVCWVVIGELDRISRARWLSLLQGEPVLDADDELLTRRPA